MRTMQSRPTTFLFVISSFLMMILTTSTSNAFLLSTTSTSSSPTAHGVPSCRIPNNRTVGRNHQQQPTLLLQLLLLYSSSSSSSSSNEDVLPLLGEESAAVAAKDSKSLLDSLRDRRRALEKGIGKRYKCRTQQGFLNVHKEPGDPFNTNNIVNQLLEGDIVTSTGPPRGPWIPHDQGGWSISIYNGFKWLEPLNE